MYRSEAVPTLPTLKRIRESQFLTQADLSMRSGVSRVTIVRLESGDAEARFSTIRKLAKALRVRPAELVSKGDQP